MKLPNVSSSVVRILVLVATLGGFALGAETTAEKIASAPAAATRDRPFANTLGMKFVPVPGTKVLFCIHDVRKGDYRKFADAVPGMDESWKSVKFRGVEVSGGEDHPVVNVNWNEAKSFCAWLSKKEGRAYRLPTDHEWSVAAGIGDREDPKASPDSKLWKIEGEYPWGRQWPPPAGAANLADDEFSKKFPSAVPIPGYHDGYATTSPVMSFPPNSLGLYDMGGNVYQWCEDWYDASQKRRVQRGSAWRTEHREWILTSSRNNHEPQERFDGVGFRVLLVP